MPTLTWLPRSPPSPAGYWNFFAPSGRYIRAEKEEEYHGEDSRACLTVRPAKMIARQGRYWKSPPPLALRYIAPPPVRLS